MEMQVYNMESENKKLNKMIEKLQIEKLKRSDGGFKYGALNMDKLSKKVEELKKKN